ncbi:MAG: cadmium-translocating P-type ATPase [Desulfobacteraceae bacterium]|nr:cadmium-translocating P-type ATPase [Desulfobacteraceae bacterium]
MKQSLTTEKFQIRNLDCANCAAKIEKGLNKVDGVDEAVIDFAGMTLHLKASDIAGALAEVRRIEPAVKLLPKSNDTGGIEPGDVSGEADLKKGLVYLIIAGVLFVYQLITEYTAHFSPLGDFQILMVLSAYLLAGWNVLQKAVRTILKGDFFDENVLMMIATGGALAIHAYSEAIGVMIFYKIGELLQDLAVSRSRRSIRGLLAARPDTARLTTPGGFREVAPESVSIGDSIMVKPGEKIPVDGEVVAGTSLIDTSALTGESVPLTVNPGIMVMAGQINQTGALDIRATRLFRDSSMAKIMDLVENATARKAKTEKFITVFARYYTPFVVLAAASVALLPPLFFGGSFQTWIYRALVLLVISCPCALVVSIPLGYFGGIGRASKAGILIKGSNFIDVLAAVKTVVFDKTGTLTRGVFDVKDVVSVNGYSKEQVMEFAAAAEYQSNHPIAGSILNAFEKKGGKIKITDITGHQNMAGKGVTARYKKHDILVGNDNFLHHQSIAHHQCDFDNTVAHVAVDGRYAGYIIIGDELKPGAVDAMSVLRKSGIQHISMLTGDNQCAAEAVAHKLGLDSFYADLFPEDKVRIFDQIGSKMGDGEKIAFVGDGINDAPVIARADVGVAMGALGSDAAIETADVVLMTDSPLKMAEAVAVAKHTRKIVWQNITLAFVIKGIFIAFGAMGLASMWEAVFADMGTALLAVFNSTRALRG